MLVTVGVISLAVSGTALARTTKVNSDLRVNKAAATAAATAPVCTGPQASAARAATLSADIARALRGRAGSIAIRVEDQWSWVECRYNEGSRFHSASVVKVTILAALLRRHQENHTSMTSWEYGQAQQMIEDSNNTAATNLWNDVGRWWFQHFLNVASMSETIPGPGGYWGLTQITARDELQQLRLLAVANNVLSNSSRSYELGLMSHVTSSQRWGTPYGAPSGLTVNVKNGWLPDPSLWVINSLGAFQGHGRNYMITVLTSGNSSMTYGVNTVQSISWWVHHDLNAGRTPAGTPLAPVVIPAAQQRPDEFIPASAYGRQ